ncbi:hypothetical protein DXA15_18335 [Parabacteroides sp. AM58-2XD]|nr:hypothetical protein DXA15_18335 [Parabacteroides sp. AM58-2XD]
MGLKSNEIDHLLIRQLKQTANKPVTRLVLLTGFNTPPPPSLEGSQLQPVNKQIDQLFLNTIVILSKNIMYSKYDCNSLTLGLE